MQLHFSLSFCCSWSVNRDGFHESENSATQICHLTNRVYLDVRLYTGTARLTQSVVRTKILPALSEYTQTAKWNLFVSKVFFFFSGFWRSPNVIRPSILKSEARLIKARGVHRPLYKTDLITAHSPSCTSLNHSIQHVNMVRWYLDLALLITSNMFIVCPLYGRCKELAR